MCASLFSRRTTTRTYYSLNWARGVIIDYSKSHARATDLALEILGLSTEELAALLANREKAWERFKGVTRIVERLLLGTPCTGLGDTGFLAFSFTVLDLCQAQRLCSEKWLLTRRRFLFMLREHTQKGGVEGSASEPRHPSFDSGSFQRIAGILPGQLELPIGGHHGGVVETVVGDKVAHEGSGARPAKTDGGEE